MLRRFDDSTVALLAPRLCGSTTYYAALAAYGNVCIDFGMPYDKRQKLTHRFDICDTHGQRSIVVPVSRPDNVAGRLRWSDILVSEHGQWWNVARTTLESAYGRTPFFEYYSNDILPLFSPEAAGDQLQKLIERTDAAIIRMLGLTSVRMIPYADTSRFDNVDDLRRSIPGNIEAIPYWQVRDCRFGFLPDMTILDLLFNMGPEAQLVLRDMWQK